MSAPRAAPAPEFVAACPRPAESRTIPPTTTARFLRLASDMTPEKMRETAGQPSFATPALSVLFDAAPDGIVVVDAEGTIQMSNRRAEDLFGYAGAELVGTTVEKLIPTNLRGRHEHHRASYIEKPSERPMGIGLELRGLRKDGSEFPIEISLNTVPEADGLVIAIVRDLTDYKRLQSFGVEALRAMEVERRRIALELHDETLQDLSALLIQLRIAQRQSPKSVDVLEDVHKALVQVTEGIRRIANALRPPELEALGVASAVRAHARHLTESTGLRTTVTADDSADDLDPDEQLALYRIVQEAISNSLKHAPKSRVEIEISRRGACVLARVEDDGAGFDVQAALARRGGLGLISMVERARHAGGKVEIQSVPGSGTAITASFDIRAEVTDG